MKKLFFIRHAKSSWKDLNLDDFNRPLNRRWKSDASFMWTILKSSNIFPDIIISSPAKRTKKTAKKIAKQLDYDKKDILYNENIYEAWFSDIIEIIKNLDNKYSIVFIIMHNPTITGIVNKITQKEIFNIPTCGVAWIDLNIKNWWEFDIEKTPWELFFYDYPKKIR